jgi:hypothetical protein
MTNPTPPGPTDPNNPHQQPFGQQSDQPQHPGGYPQTGAGPQQGWNTPAQGFNPQQPGQYGQQPYGQFDGNQDYPGGQPPKKTGLIVGLVILGVLIVGGVVALILILTNNGDNNTASSPSAPNNPPATSGPTGGQTTDNSGGLPTSGGGLPGTGGTGSTGGTGAGDPSSLSSPQAVADYMVKAFALGDAAGFAKAFCPDVLKGQTLNIPPGSSVTVTGPVTDSGFRATVTFPGQNPGNAIINLQNNGGSWCIASAPDA